MRCDCYFKGPSSAPIYTGTRGSSAKEGAADTVIAVMADRKLSGGVKNTRVALRKQRDGISGFEIPFTGQIVETGVDDDGEPTTAPVIYWQATESTQKGDAQWTQRLQLLRRVLTAALADSRQNVRPFVDGSEMAACDIEVVRAEFYKQYPADGTEKQKADAQRQAFNRSLKRAHTSGLVASREVDGVHLIWLVKPEATSA